MDAFGLPMSFGKRQAEKPAAEPAPSEPPPLRHDASGRGGRGVVGGGKRNRGRGRGGLMHATGSNSSPIPAEAFNVGIKRQHPSAAAINPNLPFRPPPPQSGPDSRGGFGQRGRGGPRGGRGGGGRGGGLHQPGEQGFFKDSFCEDPWKSLMAERERRRA